MDALDAAAVALHLRASARARESETERERAKVPRSSAPVERKRFLWFVRRPRSLVWLANTHSLDCVHLRFAMCLEFALPWIGCGA